MLKTSITKNTVISSILFLLLAFSNSCSEMGKQPPEWASGVFTPNGKYFVYLYKIFNVTYYERSGGIEHRSGNTTYYLQAIDCASGEKVLSKPITFGNNTSIIDVDDRYIWIKTQVADDENKKDDIVLYDLEAAEMKFKQGQLSQLNPTVPMGSHSFYINETGHQGLVLQGADGRYYLINPETGKFFVMRNDPLKRLELKHQDTYQLSNHTKRISLRGSPRAQIEINDDFGRPVAKSNDDYLHPEILCTTKKHRTDEQEETNYHNSFFILEPALTNSDKEHIISRVDYTTLAPIWRTAVIQNLSDREGSVRNKFRFHLQDDHLYLANAKAVYVIHAETGDIVREFPLF